MVFHLVREWKALGHEIRIVAGRSHRRLKSQEIIDGIPVRRFYFVFGLHRWNIVAILKYLLLWLFVPSTMLGLWRHLVASRPDLVHVHLHLRGDLVPYLSVFALLSRVPWFITVHGLDTNYDAQNHIASTYLTRVLLKRVKKITTVSYHLRDQLHRWYPDIKEPMVVVHNGLDPRPFYTAKAYIHPRPYVLCVARMTDHVKGQHILIEAFRDIANTIPDLDLILVGDGPMRADLENKVKENGLGTRVLFYGEATPQEVASTLKGCAVLVVPSLYEPFGLVCLEGAVLHKPIVASRVGGIPEALEGYPLAHLVEPGSVQELKQGVLFALRQCASQRDQGASAKPFFQKELDWTHVSREYLKEFAL